MESGSFPMPPPLEIDQNILLAISIFFFNAACLCAYTIPGYTIKEQEQENKRIEKTVL